MSRVIGIDLRLSKVRAVVLKAVYRKLELEALSEESLADHATPADAVRACITRLGGLDGHRVDTIAASLDGSKVFVHLLTLPPSAEKRLEELLPFELEAQLPVDIDDVVYSHELLPRPRGSKQALEVLTVSARIEHVRTRIEQIKGALAREPDRVGASAIELGQLVHVCSLLRSPEPIVVVDVGEDGTDLCLLVGGSVRGARSLSLGVSAFPARAKTMTAQMRQTLAGFEALSGGPVKRLFVSGEGLELPGILPYFQAELGIETSPLPELSFEGMKENDRVRLPAFARALGAALHGARGKGFDLRQGPLSFQRGYSYLKDRAPLLLGMSAAVVTSFLFSTWAEGRALDNEHAVLAAQLEQITRATLGEATSDPDEAQALLDRARKAKPEDPMPYIDGFGVAVAFAETLPADIKHDAEQFDFSKGKLKLRGIVDSTDQVQRIAKALDEHRCIENSTVTKISQVVNSERERYMLEADVRCPEDPPDPKQLAALQKEKAEKAAQDAAKEETP